MKEYNFLCPKCRAQLVPNRKIVLLAKPSEGPSGLLLLSPNLGEYSATTPCRTCAMLIINCGIVRVVCEKKYHAGKESEDLFRDTGVELYYFSEDIEAYENQ